ncbi:hypothetical protein [Weissella confusa]|uniref:hypothetical protein n=1 Tax=Weissella confusa TaxID=1583 RepID=UPI001A7E414C|nr:hypothetical protein [Weissella confusa]
MAYEVAGNYIRTNVYPDVFYASHHVIPNNRLGYLVAGDGGAHGDILGYPSQ